MKMKPTVNFRHLLTAIAGLVLAVSAAAQTTSLRFEVRIARGTVQGPQNGRLFVFLNKKGDREPRLSDDDVSLDAPPMLAKDISSFGSGSAAVIDNTSISYPIADLAHLRAGEYYVQALLDTNSDVSSLNAPGNLYSPVQKVTLDPAKSGTVRLVLDKAVPPETMPADTDYVKFLKIQSPLLTKFYGRPIYVRAAALLPRTYLTEACA